ncbi:MAG TPA: hypothetical protein VGK86_15460 [Thermoanaerobaculia bacterium]|jgi:hypothetical protein
MKRVIGIAAAFCFLVGAQAAFAQTKMHTETKTKQTGPGPNVKVKTETVVGTVKEFEAGKKIKVTGPNNKDYSFDLDEAVRVDGAVAVGQMAKVEWVKGSDGKERVKLIALYTTPAEAGTAAGTAKTMPAVHMKTEKTVHQPGPDVKTKTETVIGTVKEFEAGKKIKVTGPNNKDYSFDLDQNVSMKGTVGVGQRVKVEYTKGDMGNHVTVVSLMKGMKSKKTRKAA